MGRRKEIEIGTRFNKLVTLENIDRSNKPYKVLCQCDCGNIKNVNVNNLKSNAIGCGKCKGKTASIGDKFGRWTVIENSFIENGNTKVICKCECGTIAKRNLTELSKKTTKSSSCGCYQKEKITTHGKTKTKLYKIYSHVIERCRNINNASYSYYGERGITVCDEWLNDFQTFYDWAMENGYQKGLEIDRKDNTLNYSPDNCRWVTPQQNNWNRGPRINSSSKYKGLTWDKERNKWIVHIMHNKKMYYLGRFDNEEEAALTYNEKAKELFGEYAYLNKITQ